MRRVAELRRLAMESTQGSWRLRANRDYIVAAGNALPALLDVAEAAGAFMGDDWTWDRERNGDPGPALRAALNRLDSA